ncbi:restriction endonuclease subunit S [Coraliomargarita akajimensis]|uniref:restriction endonuclease subunit S n=1 Tax=Coraliomargarita akajimensis TaxID=395922 RepID=UPI001C258B9F|nr:restriction endonuclease subunit S [Coraliomargarita akajimensis]
MKPRGDVIADGEFLSRAESLVGYKFCKANDLVMNIMLAWKRGLGVTKYDGIVSPAYSVFRFGEYADPDYMHYLLRTDLYTGHFKTRSTGVIDSRLRLYPESFGDTSILLPSLPEQKQIARFLDHETAKIDRLIAKQQELIALLKEKRQAVISHAVTKGLNPDAKMKDSGVEWLGQVPEHWEVTYLTHIVDPSRRIMYGIVLPGPNVDNGVPIVKGGDVKPGRLRLDSLCKTTYVIESNYERSRLKTGDIVYSIRGTIGDVEIVPEEINGANLTQDAARIAPKVPSDNRWLMYTMKSTSVFSQLEVGSLGAAVRGINIRDLKKAIIPYPPQSERNDIEAFLDIQLGKLDRLSVDCKRQIELLQERRTALISAAVTGKIDVRDWEPEKKGEA